MRRLDGWCAILQITLNNLNTRLNSLLILHNCVNYFLSNYILALRAVQPTTEWRKEKRETE